MSNEQLAKAFDKLSNVIHDESSYLKDIFEHENDKTNKIIVGNIMNSYLRICIGIQQIRKELLT